MYKNHHELIVKGKGKEVLNDSAEEKKKGLIALEDGENYLKDSVKDPKK